MHTKQEQTVVDPLQPPPLCLSGSVNLQLKYWTELAEYWKAEAHRQQKETERWKKEAERLLYGICK
jgi:hypothetical protein